MKIKLGKLLNKRKDKHKTDRQSDLHGSVGHETTTKLRRNANLKPSRLALTVLSHRFAVDCFSQASLPNCKDSKISLSLICVALQPMNTTCKELNECSFWGIITMKINSNLGWLLIVSRFLLHFYLRTLLQNIFQHLPRTLQTLSLNLKFERSCSIFLWQDDCLFNYQL